MRRTTWHGSAAKSRSSPARPAASAFAPRESSVAEVARIVAAGRRAPEGEALASRLGASCVFRQTDVTVEEQMRALIEQAVEKFGRIDCLFNNAGGPGQTGGIEGLDVRGFAAAMAAL